jgi:hypothetical protein
VIDEKVKFVSGGVINVNFGTVDGADGPPYDAKFGDAAIVGHETGHAADYEEDSTLFLSLSYEEQEVLADESRDKVVKELEEEEDQEMIMVLSRWQGWKLWLSVGAFFSAVLSVAAAAPQFESLNLDLSDAAEIARQVGVNPDLVTQDLVSVKRVELNVLTWSVAQLDFQGSVPADQVVAIELLDEWRLIQFNSQLSKSWDETLRLVTMSRSLNGSDPQALAEDLALILVSPQEKYGRVIVTSADIPVNLLESDTLRDLIRLGYSEAERRDLLLKNLRESIRPPTIDASSGDLIFSTWDYFGGFVVEWSVPLAANQRASYRVLGERIGSWDHRM